jgi:Uma2 family endonuclease
MTELLETQAPPALCFETFEDWLAWATRQDEWTELEDGKVVFVHRNRKGEYVGVKLIHQILSLFLYRLIFTYLLRAAIDGVVLVAPIMMRTMQRPRYGREPDLIYLSPERRHQMRDTHIEGAADLCIEIVSPESAERDRDVKFLEYQEAGVSEYWLIDPDARSAQFWRLNEAGQYVRVPPDADGVYVSTVIPGLALRPAWLWEESLPGSEVWEELWSARA